MITRSLEATLADDTFMRGKTCIITGASSGIGKETARGLARQGARVVMVSRDPQRGEAARDDVRRSAAHGDVDLLLADLSSQASIRQLASDILSRYEQIDVLVNNAGAMYTARSLTVDGIERTFATNHLAYMLLTHLLLDRIKQSAPARIINVSSRAHERASMNFDDLQFERGFSVRYVYGHSKLANVLYTYELARRLEGSGVTANCLHPGVVRTGFGRNNTSDALGLIVNGGIRLAGFFFIGPEKGAETSIHLASSPDVEGVTGKYFVRSQETPSSAASHDREAAQRLWEISERLCRIAAGAKA
jgi:NAD(P)-dependent dehydrogenase (short-subunit alcohol dehydrogenase family)